MFQSQNPYPFNDFYEGLQDLNNSHDFPENFGKTTNFHLNANHAKGYKKNTSVQSFSMSQATNGPIKKSSSSNTFSGQENDTLCFGKSASTVKFNDASTRASQSHISSVTSISSASSNQNLSSQKGNIKPPGKKKPPTEMDFRNKYKTEVCRYWAVHGFCEFGDQCAFAHGGNEIRQKAFVAQNFKTKRCVSYHETSYCVYGVRCQFLHCYRHDCHLNPRLMFSNYAEDLDNAEVWETEDRDCFCLKRRARPRLPVFRKLAYEH